MTGLSLSLTLVVCSFSATSILSSLDVLVLAGFL
jgi:hypothetical protein